MRPLDIAAELGFSKATVSWHLRRLGADGPTAYIGRRAVVATLGSSGVRVSELCDIRIRDLRLQAATGARFRIPDAKSEAGSAHLCPNLRGGRMNRQRAAEIVGEALSSLPSGSSPAGFPRFRTRRLTRFAARISRSRCWRTASTCCGS
jgi:hypothetical protein